jgi:hypothetical protein
VSRWRIRSGDDGFARNRIGVAAMVQFRGVRVCAMPPRGSKRAYNASCERQVWLRTPNVRSVGFLSLSGFIPDASPPTFFLFVPQET